MCNYRVSDLDFTLNCYKALRGDTSVRPRELYTPHHPPARPPTRMWYLMQRLISLRNSCRTHTGTAKPIAYNIQYTESWHCPR